MKKKVSWTNAVVLIAGASAGAGYGVAFAAARRRAKHIVLVARGKERLLQSAASIKAIGGSCEVQGVDLTQRSQIDMLVADLARRGLMPDIVVYSAAAGGFECFDECSDEGFDLAMRSTAYGAFALARRCLPVMLARGSGAFVIVGSPVHNIAFPAIAYLASRHAIYGVFDALSEDLRSTPIVVTFAEPARISNSGYFDSNVGVAPRLPFLSRLPMYRASWQSDREVGEMVCRDVQKGRRISAPFFLGLVTRLAPRAFSTWLVRLFPVAPADGGFPRRGRE